MVWPSYDTTHAVLESVFWGGNEFLSGLEGRWFPRLSWCVSAFTRLGICVNRNPGSIWFLSPSTHPQMISILTSLGSPACQLGTKLLPLFVWHSGQSPGPVFQALNELGHFWLVTSSPFLCILHLFWGRTKCSTQLGWHSRDKLLFGDKNTVTFIWGFCFVLVWF